MATKKKIEYGFIVAPVGVSESEKSVSKTGFFERMEAQYPSSDGWEVWSVSVTPTGTAEVVVAYHLRKVNA